MITASAVSRKLFVKLNPRISVKANSKRRGHNYMTPNSGPTCH